MTLDDILVVAPYNMQVNLLRSILPDKRGIAALGMAGTMCGYLWAMLRQGRPARTTSLRAVLSIEAGPSSSRPVVSPQNPICLEGGDEGEQLCKSAKNGS